MQQMDEVHVAPLGHECDPTVEPVHKHVASVVYRPTEERASDRKRARWVVSQWRPLCPVVAVPPLVGWSRRPARHVSEMM